MLDKVKEYFEDKYRETKRAIDREYDWMTPREFINRGISDCLAVAMFAQTIGVKYEIIDPIYNEYKEKIENLLTD